MKYTKEQIDKLINDPLVQLLCSVTGTSPKELFVDPEGKKIYEKPEVIESQNTYPLSTDEFKNLVFTMKQFYNEIDKWGNIGLDWFETDISNIIHTILNLLIGYIWDEDKAKLWNDVDWFNIEAEDIANHLLKHYE